MDDLINYIEHELSSGEATIHDADIYRFQDEFLGVNNSPLPISLQGNDNPDGRDAGDTGREHTDYLEMSPPALEDLLESGHGFETLQEEDFLQQYIGGDGRSEIQQGQNEEAPARQRDSHLASDEHDSETFDEDVLQQYVSDTGTYETPLHQNEKVPAKQSNNHLVSDGHDSAAFHEKDVLQQYVSGTGTYETPQSQNEEVPAKQSNNHLVSDGHDYETFHEEDVLQQYVSGAGTYQTPQSQNEDITVKQLGGSDDQSYETFQEEDFLQKFIDSDGTRETPLDQTFGDATLKQKGDLKHKSESIISDSVGFDLEGFSGFEPCSPALQVSQKLTESSCPEPIDVVPSWHVHQVDYADKKQSFISPKERNVPPLSPSDTHCNDYFHTMKLPSPRKVRRLASPRNSHETTEETFIDNSDGYDGISKGPEHSSFPAGKTEKKIDNSNLLQNSVSIPTLTAVLSKICSEFDIKPTDPPSLPRIFCSDIGREVTLYNYNDFPSNTQTMILQQTRAGNPVIELPGAQQRQDASLIGEAAKKRPSSRQPVSPDDQTTGLTKRSLIHESKDTHGKDSEGSLKTSMTPAATGRVGADHTHKAPSLLQEAAMAAGLFDFDDSESRTSCQEDSQNKPSNSATSDTRNFQNKSIESEADTLRAKDTRFINTIQPSVKNDGKQTGEHNDVSDNLQNLLEYFSPETVRKDEGKCSNINLEDDDASADDIFSEHVWDASVPPSSSSSSRESSVHGTSQVPTPGERQTNKSASGCEKDNGGVDTLEFLNKLMGNEGAEAPVIELAVQSSQSPCNDFTSTDIISYLSQENDVFDPPASVHQADNEIRSGPSPESRNTKYETVGYTETEMKEKFASGCLDDVAADQNKVNPMETSTFDQRSFFAEECEGFMGEENLLEFMSSSNPHLPDTNPSLDMDFLMSGYVRDSASSQQESLDYLNCLLTGNLDSPHDIAVSTVTETKNVTFADMDTTHLDTRHSPITESGMADVRESDNTNIVVSGSAAPPVGLTGSSLKASLEDEEPMETFVHQDVGHVTTDTSSNSEWIDVESVVFPTGSGINEVESCSIDIDQREATVVSTNLSPQDVTEGDLLNELNKHLASLAQM